MTIGPQLFRIDSENRESDRVEEVDFARLGLRERRDIQEWIAVNPEILGDDLLVVGKEFSGFDRTNERLDLLAVDADGRLVIIELKRDDTGADAHWQAIKYASYLRNATPEDIVSLFVEHGGMSDTEAIRRLLQHLDSDDLNELNNDQRIILASHRFAPEVTNAVLWLNDKVPGDDFITCIQLTPHHDAESNSLYVQVNTIIPVPGTKDLTVGIGAGQDSGSSRSSSFGEALRKSFARSIKHEATPFLRRVGSIVLQGVSDTVRPNRRSRWALVGVEVTDTITCGTGSNRRGGTGRLHIGSICTRARYHHGGQTCISLRTSTGLWTVCMIRTFSPRFLSMVKLWTIPSPTKSQISSSP